MTRMQRQPLRKVLVPLYPIVVTVAAAALASSIVSCGGKSAPPADAPRLQDELVDAVAGQPPQVRVRLFAAPVESVEVMATGPARLYHGQRPMFQSTGPMPRITIRRFGGDWQVGSQAVAAGALQLTPLEGSALQVVRTRDGVRKATRYRGVLRFVPVGNDRLLVINELDIESYLAGVLAEELYGGWHLEAYRAQAIAARTHAWHNILTRASDRAWDVNDDASSQVYGGIEGETDKARQAVGDTRGVVLTCHTNGQRHLFLAQYSSCCGGRVNGAAVIRRAADIRPLEGGQYCSDCNQPGNSRFRWPSVVVGKDVIYQQLLRHDRGYYQPLGGVRSVRVLRGTDWGRPVWLQVEGTSGQARRVRAEDLRLLLIRTPAGSRLYSMNCDVIDRGGTVEFADGRGYGHGVGMCQWGAQGKALKGYDHRDILGFYYPGADLFKAWRQ